MCVTSGSPFVPIENDFNHEQHMNIFGVRKTTTNKITKKTPQMAVVGGGRGCLLGEDCPEPPRGGGLNRPGSQFPLYFILFNSQMSLKNTLRVLVIPLLQD